MLTRLTKKLKRGIMKVEVVACKSTIYYFKKGGQTSHEKKFVQRVSRERR